MMKTTIIRSKKAITPVKVPTIVVVGIALLPGGTDVEDGSIRLYTKKLEIIVLPTIVVAEVSVLPRKIY